MLGHTEIIVVAVVVLVLFGAKALPKFARGIGQAKKEFKKSLEEGEVEDDNAQGGTPCGRGV